MEQQKTRKARTPRNPLLPDTATIRAWSVRIGCAPISVEREIIKSGSVTGEAGRRVRRGLAAIRSETQAAYEAQGFRPLKGVDL